MRHWFRIFAIGALAVSLAGCSKSETAQASSQDGAAKPVKVEPVRQESVSRAVDVVGTLTAVDQVTISSEADGKVSRILADLGDRVKAGQVLMQIDNEKQQYTLRAAAGRARARARAVRRHRSENLPEIEKTPDVQRANADLVQAQAGVRARQRAVQAHAHLAAGARRREGGAAVEAASYNAALQNAQNLRASIQASEATMKLAGRQLRDTEIRAPFDGFVEKRLVNLGELVKTQMPVMAIVRLDPLKVTAEIPEKMAPWITAGRPVELQVDAYPRPHVHRQGVADQPGVNTATRAFPFEALVPNPDAVLKPGTFARVHIESGKVDPC